MSETPSPPPPPERIPPPTPGQLPPPPPPESAPRRLKFWQAFLLGMLMFVVSLLLCFANAYFGLMGFIVAVVCLFIPGYRHIFTGYITMIGIALLVAIIACAYNPPDFH